MTEVTRRDAIAAAAATAIASMGASVPAGAAAPAAGRRAPGWYRYKVGDLEVTVVTDGARAFDLTPSYVTNAPIEEVRKALEAAYMPPNRMIHHYAPIVINTGGKLVVIDTGGGPGAYKETKGELGQFAENLAAAGIDPQCDRHGGHLAFPRRPRQRPARCQQQARVPECRSAGAGGRVEVLDGRRRDEPRLGRAAWPTCSRTTAASSMRSAARSRPMAGARRSRRASLPVATTGHSIGHTSYVVSSGKSTVYVQSDVTHNPDLFARHPDWGGAFDQDPNAGGGDAAQGLRHAGRRQAAGAGLPLSVPGAGARREGGQRLPRHSGAVASDAVSAH